MNRLKKVAVCSAVVALMGVASSPAVAKTFPGGGGQPVSSGQLGNGHSVIHCQAAMEYLISLGMLPPMDLKPGMFPGVVIVGPYGPSGTTTFRVPGNQECPLGLG